MKLCQEKNKTISPTLVRVGGTEGDGRVVKPKMETSPTRRNQTIFSPHPNQTHPKEQEWASIRADTLPWGIGSW